MSTKHRRSERSTDPRPTYIALGRDAEGREHVYRTYAEEVVVIRDGQRVHIEDLTEMKVEQWMNLVADRIGWDRADYGVTPDRVDRYATWVSWG